MIKYFLHKHKNLVGSPEQTHTHTPTPTHAHTHIEKLGTVKYTCLPSTGDAEVGRYLGRTGQPA